jgi:thioredoxin 1
MATFFYIVIAVVGLFVTMQVFMVLKMKAKKGSAAPQLDGRAGRMIKEQGEALFYFYSPGCRACKPMTPYVKSMAEKNKQVMPVDVSQEMAIAQKFGVMGTPSTVLVQDSKIIEFLVGFQPEDKVKSLLAG